MAGYSKKRTGHHWQFQKPVISADETSMYVRDVFFNFEKSRFVEFANFYEKKYGTGAKAYLKATFEKWKSGSTQMSGETCDRILHCVPKFMTIEEQFHIIALYIPRFHDNFFFRANIFEFR